MKSHDNYMIHNNHLANEMSPIKGWLCFKCICKVASTSRCTIEKVMLLGMSLVVEDND